jgi:hypothetical protein
MIEIVLEINNTRRATLAVHVPHKGERLRDAVEGWVYVTNVYQETGPEPKLIIVAHKISEGDVDPIQSRGGPSERL